MTHTSSPAEQFAALPEPLQAHIMAVVDLVGPMEPDDLALVRQVTFNTSKVTSIPEPLRMVSLWVGELARRIEAHRIELLLARVLAKLPVLADAEVPHGA